MNNLRKILRQKQNALAKLNIYYMLDNSYSRRNVEPYAYSLELLRLLKVHKAHLWNMMVLDSLHKVIMYKFHN